MRKQLKNYSKIIDREIKWYARKYVLTIKEGSNGGIRMEREDTIHTHTPLKWHINIIKIPYYSRIV